MPTKLPIHYGVVDLRDRLLYVVLILWIVSANVIFYWNFAQVYLPQLVSRLEALLRW